MTRCAPHGRTTLSAPTTLYRTHALFSPCHSEPVTDVTGVGIRSPRPQARPRLPCVKAAQCSHWVVRRSVAEVSTRSVDGGIAKSGRGRSPPLRTSTESPCVIRAGRCGHPPLRTDFRRPFRRGRCPHRPVCRGSAAASSLPCVKGGGIVCTGFLPCHSEPVTDVTGVGIRSPFHANRRPLAATYLCRFAAKARFDNRLTQGERFPKGRAAALPLWSFQGEKIFKKRGKSKSPFS